MPPLRFQRDHMRKRNRSPHPSFASQMPPSPKGEGLWAAKGRPYRTCKRLSGEYRRGRSQTGPPSMGKFPGFGGRGTPQGGFSRPSADSPSALPLRVFLEMVLDLGRGAPWGSRRKCTPSQESTLIRHGFAAPPSPLEGEGYLYRERWLGKLRRRSGTAPTPIFANPGPSGPEKTAPKHS